MKGTSIKSTENNKSNVFYNSKSVLGNGTSTTSNTKRNGNTKSAASIRPPSPVPSAIPRTNKSIGGNTRNVARNMAPSPGNRSALGRFMNRFRKRGPSVDVRLPLPEEQRKRIDNLFNFVQRKLNTARRNLSVLLGRAKGTRYELSIQRFFEHANRTYRDVDVQRMKWRIALYNKKTVQQTVKLPNFPLEPLQNKRLQKGLKYDQNSLLPQAVPDLQRTFNYIGQQYAYMKEQLRNLPPPIVQRGKPGRYAFLKKTFSSGLLPKLNPMRWR